jgi:hypothetical protein
VEYDKVFMAVIVQIVVLWAMTPCTLFTGHQHVVGTYSLHPQVIWNIYYVLCMNTTKQKCEHEGWDRNMGRMGMHIIIIVLTCKNLGDINFSQATEYLDWGFCGAHSLFEQMLGQCLEMYHDCLFTYLLTTNDYLPMIFSSMYMKLKPCN